MVLRSLILLGLCLLAVSQCSEARHSMHRREAEVDVYAADEPGEDYTQNDDTQNDEIEQDRLAAEESNQNQAKILTKPQIYKVEPGSDVKLECNIDSDSTVVQWFKGSELYFMNTMKMIADSRYSLSNTSKDMLIQNVQKSDGGVFKCVVVQQETVSVNHTVVVLAPPQIVRFTATKEGSVVEGEDLRLTCEVTGTPPPEIVWSRAVDNANKRLGANDGEFSQNSVYIRGVKREYSGKYYCYAINSLGHNQAEIEITVAGKPHVHVHKTVVNSAVNVEAILECSTKFDYNPHIRWYKDGALIEDTSTSYTVSTLNTHSNLTVIPKSDADFGTFTCEAQNDVGKHNRSISLVQRPVVEELDTEGGKLKWTVHSHQPIVDIQAQLTSLAEGSDVTMEFKIPLPTTASHKYELVYNLNDKHLEPGKYQAFVKVSNEHGWNDMVDPVVVDIDVQPEFIQHAQVFGGSSAHSTRPSTVIPSTILMYLLVRML